MAKYQTNKQTKMMNMVKFTPAKRQHEHCCWHCCDGVQSHRVASLAIGYLVLIDAALQFYST